MNPATTTNVPVSNRPAGDYASGDDSLNFPPSELIQLNEHIAALVPELRIDIQGTFCLREGVHLTGAPGQPPQVRDAFPGNSRVADLGSAAQGGNDGALYAFLFGNGTHAWADEPCFLHTYLIGFPVNTKLAVNVRDLMREIQAVKSIADIKAIIHRYNPDQNITDIETRWPWAVKAMADAFAAASADVQRELSDLGDALDHPPASKPLPPVAPGSTPVKIVGPVHPDVNNSLKGRVSISGNVMDLAIMPDGRAFDNAGHDVTASLTAQGVDVGLLLLAFEGAAMPTPIP